MGSPPMKRKKKASNDDLKSRIHSVRFTASIATESPERRYLPKCYDML